MPPYRPTRALAKEIVATITVRNERNDYLEKCENSGLRLIGILFAKRADIGPIANNAASLKIAVLIQAGPGERSMAAWNSWREEFDTWNKVQSDDALLKGPLLAQKYAAAACQLGSPLDADIRNEIRSTGAKGDPKKTLEAITAMISEYEATNFKPGSAGGGLAAYDPRKTLPPGGGDSGGGGDQPTKPCYYCKEMHWHKDCPVYKKRLAERSKKKGERRAAKAALKAEKEKDAEKDTKRATPKPAAARKGAEQNDKDDDDKKSEKSEKGAGMLAAGEVMINDAFYDGGSKTVSLSGASLAALAGQSPRLDDAPLSVEDIDDSASDSSVSSDESVDPDDPDDEMASLVSPSEDDSDSDGAASAYSGKFESSKPKASSSAGLGTPSRRSLSKPSGGVTPHSGRPSSTRSHRRDFESTPATPASEARSLSRSRPTAVPSPPRCAAGAANPRSRAFR